MANNTDAVDVLTCSRCRQSKTADLFSWRYKDGMRAGRATLCRSCRSDDSAAWKARRLDEERRLGATSRLCGSCKMEKPRDAFCLKQWTCKECRRQATRDHNKSNPEVFRGRHLWDRYKMTLEEYEKLLRAQNGVCATCLRPPGERLLHVDHDHACCPSGRTCGKCVRGLLCNTCNVKLVVLETQSELSLRMHAYLGVKVVPVVQLN